MKKLIERKTTILIAFVVIMVIALIVHPVSGLVTGVLSAPAVEGINRYRTTESGQFRGFDWWNVAAIWAGTLAAAAVVAVGILVNK